ncbi:hypothetical protein VTO42DRAFT_6008 [Malbranchea cinnamomea]
MFRPTKCLQARLRLTTKQVNGGYYKGTRTGSMGYFAKEKGKYIIDWKKVRTYVVPENLEDFKLTPFVTKAMAPTKDIFTKTIVRGGREVVVPRGYNGMDFLKDWVEENPMEYADLKYREEEFYRQMDVIREKKAETDRLINVTRQFLGLNKEGNKAKEMEAQQRHGEDDAPEKK